MLDLIKRILEAEADLNRHLATYDEVTIKNSYCTIELVEDIPIVVFREPIPYEEEMTTDLGHL